MAGPASISFHAQVLPFAVPALGGLLFGYDIGATSGAVVNLTDADITGAMDIFAEKAQKIDPVHASRELPLAQQDAPADRAVPWGCLISVARLK